MMFQTLAKLSLVAHRVLPEFVSVQILYWCGCRQFFGRVKAMKGALGGWGEERGESGEGVYQSIQEDLGEFLVMSLDLKHLLPPSPHQLFTATSDGSKGTKESKGVSNRAGSIPEKSSLSSSLPSSFPSSPLSVLVFLSMLWIIEVIGSP